ncbi:conserved hypothetical protein [Pyrenophora tritici-repentis Pt-1C-BFP]|uniref:Major facilitator superfamily (MFS) profile domain-containing protein n=1 Tax=Pyrenophora tritici-repentis (strain Pt-1C-BFP) TaxID=426418 RepID=B2WFE5_PYRTR|nr:uncharacterized protein PTRG_09213 [Pyrenophora tritici-repentis Pt-1C-BFP]EDU42264.1 conserved hypothetical protein [Pyrenophora tritici-repentis Pt-1C-BFP]
MPSPSTPPTPTPPLNPTLDIEKLPSNIPSTTPPGPAPDGGPTAWLNCAGAFCIFFCCLGFTSCSLAGFIQFASGVVGGPGFDRWGVWIIRPATLLYILSLMLLSLCIHYPHFILTHALGFGWSIRIVAFIMMPFMLFVCMVLKPRFPPRKESKIWIGEPWRQGQYVGLVVALFFMMMGMWTPVFYIPVYAVRRGMTPLLASYLLAIINGASTLGRVIPGIIADRLGRVNMFTFAGLSTGVVVFCINVPTTNAGIIVYSVFFGFISGTIISSGSAAISLCAKDPRTLGTYMGMGMGVAAIAVLIGPPINGALLDRYGGFEQMSVFSGVMSVTGGLIALSAKFGTAEGIFGKWREPVGPGSDREMSKPKKPNPETLMKTPSLKKYKNGLEEKEPKEMRDGQGKEDYFLKVIFGALMGKLEPNSFRQKPMLEALLEKLYRKFVDKNTIRIMVRRPRIRKFMLDVHTRWL